MILELIHFTRTIIIYHWKSWRQFKHILQTSLSQVLNKVKIFESLTDNICNDKEKDQTILQTGLKTIFYLNENIYLISTRLTAL